MSNRRHFIISQQLTPFVINGVLNGWIAWATHKNHPPASLWGAHGYWSDLVLTGVLLPGITWLILWPLIRKQAAAGKAPATDGVPEPWALRFLPSTLWGGSAVIGILGGLIGLVVAGIMHALGAPSLPAASYMVFKGVYGGMLSVLLQPSMVFAILRSVRAVPARA